MRHYGQLGSPTWKTALKIQAAEPEPDTC
jgi:hypothetical protein